MKMFDFEILKDIKPKDETQSVLEAFHVVNDNLEINESIVRDMQDIVSYSIENFKEFLKEKATDLYIKTQYFYGQGFENYESANLSEFGETAKEVFTEQVRDTWENKTPIERVETYNRYIQCLNEKFASLPGFEMKGVRIDPSLTPSERGYSPNPSDGYIYLNQDTVSISFNMIDAIDTCAHEARHYYQQKALESPTAYGLNKETEEEWSMQYISPEFDRQAYSNQPVERDARAAGAQALKAVFDL